MVEGTVGVQDALDAGALIEAVFAAPGADAATLAAAETAGIPVHLLAAGVLERVADTVTPQPLAAVVGFVDQPLNALRDASFIVVCVDVRDPGNVGTLLRTAEASGAQGVIFTNGSVDVYNPKAVRASAGSVFHVPIVVGGEAVSVVNQLDDWGLQTVGACAHGGVDPSGVNFTSPVALLVGNEAHGLPSDVEAALKARVTIPLAGRAESLNVAMATAVLAFEIARQRRADR